jgi:tetratricopeptide (TPR) repeat protein
MLFGLLLSLQAAPAAAGKTDPEGAITDAQRTIAEVKQGVSSVEQVVANAKVDTRSPEARIADGELLLRGKDFSRAAAVFNQVVEKYPTHPTAFPDALYLLGEAYYQGKEFLSARRAYRQIIDKPTDPRFASYQARSLARLIDISLRTKDYRALDDIFAKMSQLPATAVQGELAYARAKGLFAKNDLPGTKSALASVGATGTYYHQARYLLGVVAMKEAGASPEAGKGAKDTAVQTLAQARARYAPAIELFRQVTQLAGDTADHKHVIDLAWLAMARLFYETDQYVQASQAYGHVDRSSNEFSTMLYELAWDYVRIGDSDRALRSLEVLAVADPNSPYLADGTLLRADLLLRTGQFEKSLSLYQAARAQYDPMRGKVDAFLGSSSDPAVFYDKLSKERVEGIETPDNLPPLAVDWAREGEDGPAAFAVIDDAKGCRELLRQANSFAERLSAALNAPNRVRAFPELKAGEEKTLSLLNGITRARQRIAEGLDAVEDEHVAGDMNRVREERRSIQKRLAYLPVTDGDFAAREEQAQGQWNVVSQRLQQLTLQVDQLQAIVNGLKRTITEGPTRGVVRDPATMRSLEGELAQNEQDLGVYRSEMALLRKQIEMSRAQVGFGDQRFVEDAEARVAFKKALAEEVRLAAQGAGGGSATPYAQRLPSLLADADSADQRLESVYADLESRVGGRAKELRAAVDKEIANLTSYASALDGLDSESRLAVGQVAMRNFGQVRDRLKNIVLRADVGVTEEAWEVREEDLMRVRNLQVERARSEQQLNEELREVLDDAGETSSKPGSAK